MQNFAMSSFLVLIFSLISVIYCEKSDEIRRPLVQITQGELLGEIWKSHRGLDYFAFKSIPYAEPPIGSLRFKPPLKAKQWDGVRDCQQYQEIMCAQMTFEETLDGVEDCLYLNVYTPNMSLKEKSESLPLHPVMIFIHGGGFFAGAGTTRIYGPDYFMDLQNVVVVTINYRLGPLGFWTLQDEAAPGNVGLRDQIQALEWVRENIIHFGGNPNNVHLFGESAGGISVLFLMTSPQAKGLFHSAMSLSGPSISSYTHWDKEPKIYGKRFATELGCNQEASEEIVRCMQDLPALALPELLQFFLQFKWTGPNVWMPYTDARHVKDPILPFDPEVAFKTGNYHKVPLILGTNSDEGAFNIIGYLKGIISFEEVDERWDELGPLILFHRSIDERSDTDIRLARMIKNFYLGDQKITGNNDKVMAQFIKMMGDHMFYSGVDQTIDFILESKDRAPVYHLMYSYPGSFKVVDLFVMNPILYRLKVGVKYTLDYEIFENTLGVAHADELFVMFQPHDIPIPTLFNERDEFVSGRLMKIFTNFARNKNPNSQDLPINWEPLSKQSKKFLNVTGEQNWNMEKNADHLERNKMWKNVWETLWRERNYLSSKPPLTEEEVLKQCREAKDEL